MERTQEVLWRVLAERERQKTLAGSEWDSKNSVNDWIAIATHYLSEPAKRKSALDSVRGLGLTHAEYEDSLIKAAAVIVAALEHAAELKLKDQLS